MNLNLVTLTIMLHCPNMVTEYFFAKMTAAPHGPVGPFPHRLFTFVLSYFERFNKSF